MNAPESVSGNLLADRRFQIVWAVGALTSVVRWLEMLAVGVFVFDLTGSPFDTAMMIVLRMLPLALFGALVGVVAERMSRRVLLMAGIFSMALLAIGLGALVSLERIEVWHLGVGAFLNGVFWSMDQPLRRTLIGEIAGTEQLGRGISLDSISNNGTRMLGPLFGGLLLETIGLDGAFFLGALLYGASFIALVFLHHPERSGAPFGPGLVTAVADGFRFLRTDRTLAGLMMVTVVFNIWGFPVVSMVPVIGKDVLGLSAFPVGLLASAEGAGALAGAFAAAFFAPMRHFRRIYVGGLSLYLLMTCAFGVSTDVVLSGVVLLAMGVGGAAFASMQATVVLLSSPVEIRGRMMGVLSVCIGTGPIGFIHLGLLADWLGAPGAVLLMGAEGLIALGLTLWCWPGMVARQPAPGEVDATSRA